MTKLSIIVPVYNVEQYIRPCFESIFKQGLTDDEFEVIIINDGSTDKSMEMIEDIIRQHNNITVINQDNQGLSVARNNGIKVSKGDYIFMPDSDDMLVNYSLSILLNYALETNADLIVSDFIKSYEDEIESKDINQRILNKKEKTGTELFLEDLNPNECYVWRTLYRREFLIDKKITFVPNICYQDIPFTHECYLKAGKCIRTNCILNIYRIGRIGSATESFNLKKAKDFSLAIEKTWELRSINEHTAETRKKLLEDLFISFSTYVCMISYGLKSHTERKLAIYYLKRLIPNLFFSNNMNQLVTSLCYRITPHIFIEYNYYGRKLLNLIK